MNCARTDGDYQVDWEGNNILVTHADGTAAANAFVRVTDVNDKLVTVVPIDSQADLSEYLGKNYHLRLMIWNDDLSPETLPFER